MTNDLKKIHTKVLLNMLRSARANESAIAKTTKEILHERGMCCGDTNAEWQFLPDHKIMITLNSRGNAKVSVAELKAELATREHIPNKPEAKKIRQEKAKQKRNLHDLRRAVYDPKRRA
jgi:hypothetical protein